MNQTIQMFLSRHPADSVDSSIDLAIYRQFERVGLDVHPRVLKMFELLANDSSDINDVREAKEVAYALLHQVEQGSFQQLIEAGVLALDQMEQMERMLRDDRDFMEALDALRAALLNNVNGRLNS